jgi:hypothetical protein
MAITAAGTANLLLLLLRLLPLLLISAAAAAAAAAAVAAAAAAAAAAAVAVVALQLRSNGGSLKQYKYTCIYDHFPYNRSKDLGIPLQPYGQMCDLLYISCVSELVPGSCDASCWEKFFRI